MTLTLYRSERADGGAPGRLMTNGGVNELFMPVSNGLMQNGGTILDKAWAEPDEDGIFYVGLSGTSDFDTYLFESAGTNDTENDLTGNEARYGTTRVVSSTTTSVEIQDDYNHPIWREGDYVYFYDGYIYQIDTIGLAGEGTISLEFAEEIADTDNYYAGSIISGLLFFDATGGTKYPFWVEQIVPAGFTPSGRNYNTVTFLIGT